jgi:hypothetical protein
MSNPDKGNPTLLGIIEMPVTCSLWGRKLHVSTSISKSGKSCFEREKICTNPVISIIETAGE